ncbi:MAG: TonB-dependent receptor, partial [Cyclobacteriaceae bacterium]
MKLSTAIFATTSLFLSLLNHLAAQSALSTIQGSVIDESGISLPYANIVLLEDESGDLISGSMTDEEGLFSLQISAHGKVFLKVSTIGYHSHQSEPFILNPGIKKDLGPLTLSREITDLEAITVNAAKPSVLIQADKTIVSIEGTVMAEGNNALDVVGRSPGVYVDGDGNINLNGRSGVIVLLDERPTYMSAEDLANFLRAMPADNIKSIEIINNPPAKYDAEGAAGVINLVLKRNNFNGNNGNIHIGNQYNGLHAPSTGGTINVKRGKWTSNASLNYNEWARFLDLDILR